MRFLFLASVLFAVVCATSEDDYKYQFSLFATKTGKTYSSLTEFTARYNVFKQNLDFINAHNAKNLSWSMAVNEYADMTWEEFRAVKLGLKLPARSNKKIVLSDVADESVPVSVDWRSKGVVNAVKNQGQCGSCWAFSTVASIESACALAHGKLLSLSEQQLVDCSSSYGNNGCSGGLMDYGFQYEKATGGLCLESEYPYTAQDGSCKASKCTKFCKISSYADVPANSQTALKAAVAKQPVSVAIEADQNGFQFYSSGVFDGTCGTNLDHGVVAEGYGSESGKDYWLVRNSWGSSWGENGYIKLVRTSASGPGQCGIAMSASYPIM